MFIPYAARVVGSLVASGKVPHGACVLELGAQTYSISQSAIRDIQKTLRAGRKDTEADALIPFENVVPAHNPRDRVPHMKAFFGALGFRSYQAIDISDYGENLIMDLNENLQEKYHFTETYELVTNIGVSEHLINQANFFENAHSVTATGGYMLHVLPAIGYANHGFFNYQPRFFLDLAAANGYTIEILAFIDRERPVLNMLKPSYFGTHFYFMAGLLGVAPYGNLLVAVLFKKTHAGTFVTPLQGKYVRDIGAGSLHEQYHSSEGEDPMGVPTKGYFAPGTLSPGRALVLRIQQKVLKLSLAALKLILGARPQD